MIGVFWWQSLHLRLPAVLSDMKYLGLWDPSVTDDSGEAEEVSGGEDEEGAGAEPDLSSSSISVSSKTSFSRNAFRVSAFCAFLFATSSYKMNAFSTAMSKR